MTDEEISAGRSFADFAVLYRLGALSQPLIEAFERSGIPFQTVGQTSFYEQPEIRPVLVCLWAIYNPTASFQLENITSKKQLKQLLSFLSDLRAASHLVTELIERIQQFMVEHRLAGSNDKLAERVQQLRLRAVPFEHRLGDFLEFAALQKETDAYDPRADRVTLMTFHASKGLEFPVVFLVGCEDRLLPYQREGKPFDLEEERRLFYVGMTRAQQRLFLTHAKSRFLFGQKQQNEPSPFLSDIENTLKEIKKMAVRKAAKEKETVQLKLF